MPSCDCNIKYDSQTCVVDLVVDSGSSISFLPYITHACHFNNVLLSQLAANLETY